MSYATDVKNEICRLDIPREEYLPELSAIFRNNAVYTGDKIELYTENPNIVKRIYTLIKDYYQVDISFDRRGNNNFSKNQMYVIEINTKVDIILKDLNVISENGFYLIEPKPYLIYTDVDKRAYLRGSFLAKGSINDPKTSRYHLEFSIDTEEEANNLDNILNYFNLNSRITVRDNGYMVYIKEAEKISDFLRLISANKSLLYFEDIRIYRDSMNMTNRLNNMEQANMNKVVSTALNQVEQINYIDKSIGLDILDDKTLELAKYRLKYPESSTKELSDIISLETGKPITKSGINHRFRKIKEVYERLLKEDNKKA